MTKNNNLLNLIIEGIKNKKGNNISSIDLRKIENAVCDYFVICNADSNTQVKSIVDEIENHVKKNTGEKVWKKEGLENSQWILLDYSSIVVHVFQTKFREFYKLENLWADAKIKNFE